MQIDINIRNVKYQHEDQQVQGKFKKPLRNWNEKFKKQKAQEKIIHSKINKENILEIKDMSF